MTPSPPERDENRDHRGRWRPGNTAALVLCGRRLALCGHQDALQVARRDEIREGLVADLGGEPELSTAKRVVVDRLAEAELLAQVYFAHLSEARPMTERGRTRAATLAYVQASDRVARLAGQLGLERRARSVATATEILGERR